MSEKIPGYQFIANTLKGYGLTHIFYVEAMLRMVNRQFGEMDVKRVIDVYKRQAGYPSSPGISSRRPDISRRASAHLDVESAMMATE